jgi:hypothetical protein
MQAWCKCSGLRITSRNVLHRPYRWRVKSLEQSRVGADILLKPIAKGKGLLLNY